MVYCRHRATEAPKEGICIEITIRPEQVSDYNQIANLTYAAFVEQRDDPYRPDPLITAVLRNGPHYDAGLCLVALDGVRVVGYALFAPFPFVVLGERRKGAYLAPVCLAPAYQGQGVEQRLIEAGHEAALARGCSLSLLRGDASLYARHGYHPRMYALAGCRVYAGRASIEIDHLEEGEVAERDMPFIVDAWRSVHGTDRLAWYPGDTISQWFNHASQHSVRVFRHAGRPVGYVKLHARPPYRISEFLVTPTYAPAVLERLRDMCFSHRDGVFSLALPAPAARALFGGCAWITVAEGTEADESMMLRPLDRRDAILKTYIELARQNDQNLGIIAFPAPLDVDTD